MELGVDAVGDLFNGTDNAKKSFDNVENSFNKSLTKQVFTDPAGAAKRVDNDLKKAGKSVENGLKDAGNAINNLFSP